MLSNQLIQFWNDSFADAPMKFRFIVQPALAAYFAIRPGFADAAAGRGLFFWSLFGDPARRRELLREAWTDIGKVFIAAAVVDMIGQFMVVSTCCCDRPVGHPAVDAVLIGRTVVEYSLIRE
jgi:hypothetical protein